MKIEESTLEVANFEDGRAGLGGSALELWAVDLDEALGAEVAAEEVPDGGLEFEDGLVRLSLWSR